MNKLARWLLGIPEPVPEVAPATTFRVGAPRGIAAIHTDRGDLITGEPTYAGIAGRLITLHLPLRGATPGTILRRSTLYFGTIVVNVPFNPPIMVPPDAFVTVVHVVEMGELRATGGPAPEVV
jgi:hypothetical protein